ncbi:hypothetical protein [Stenomitos frigidus]|uniref:Uncharacterized protein n=1 Tax=Stenomitos frigidus ULC18 TaxID=2107698 RepID=A0A2T1DUL0_9CYAN|nr:hypothetical protein [Stenomitos frigidus]PSB24170.1 hypothetical protein C7B82_28180 [Stenomitos frigidus ULC18]
MTNIARDEFETVKELLGSAARYAESAYRGLDRLEMMQQRSQLQIDQLTVKMDQLADAEKRTDQRLESFILESQELTKAQNRTDQRLESFIFESQRLIAKHSESIEPLKGMTERLDGVLAYLIRKEGRDEG